MNNIILSDDECVKWACLFECIYNINKYCERYGIDSDIILRKRLKPHHISLYIEDRFSILANEIETQNISSEFLNDFLNNHHK